ncbi:MULTISPECIES: hypothetical protein [Bacillus]|uniref:hypothetical protein n=1 Tax=Bacillus TaxID=1386 RepID=UPI0008FDD470|nr:MULTISPECIES: hypothetical protein [Bacillus]OJE32422.1 hypothetical protein BAQ44_22310 [Bacillus mobilis]HDR7243183.1 hypothetical protein [Bacillus mobilis]
MDKDLEKLDKELEKLEKDLEKKRNLEKKIAEFQSDLKTLKTDIRLAERKRRTKRLIDEGAYAEALIGTNDKDKFIAIFHNTYIQSKLYEKQNVLLGYLIGKMRDNDVHNYYQGELNRFKMKIDSVKDGSGAKETKEKKIKELKTIELKVCENVIGKLPIEIAEDIEPKLQLLQKWEDRHRNRLDQV